MIVPSWRRLLAAAQAGKFRTVLAWHTNRLSREDPMDAIVFYNQLRKAGVNVCTCCEGHLDLEDFTKQLLLFISQKANNNYLVQLAAKVVRGKIASAEVRKLVGRTTALWHGPRRIRSKRPASAHLAARR